MTAKLAQKNLNSALDRVLLADKESFNDFSVENFDNSNTFIHRNYGRYKAGKPSEFSPPHGGEGF